VGGKRDFGVSPDKRAIARAASRRIIAQHPGERSESGDVQPRAGTDTREAGVGGQEAGPGSFSGGDVDVSITGVGTAGSGVAQSGPDDEEEIGQAQSSGGSEEFASGPPAQGRQPSSRRGGGGGGGAARGRGSTVTPISEDTTAGEQADTSVGFTSPERSSAAGRESSGSGR